MNALLRALAVLLLGALAGGAAGWLARAGGRPEPERGQLSLHRADFHMDRRPDDPLVVTPAKWLQLPQLFGDFDLTCDLEIAEDTDVDLLLRKVEPRQLGSQVLPFHGRFQVLRLSTRRDGPPWRNRVEALLGPPGGVSLAPGLLATVAIQARGRRLHANVAGKRLPEVLADDEHGGLALIAHGGKAVVRSLHIDNLHEPGDGLTDVQAFFADPRLTMASLRWPLVGAALGAMLAALAAMLRRPVTVIVAASVLLPLGAWLARSWLLAGQLPLLQPEPLTLAAITMAGAPLWCLVAVRGWGRWALGVVGAAAWLWLALGVVAVERPRSAPTPELDALLGPDAGEGVAEALAARVRGPRAIHAPEDHAHRVFLLGGQQLWDRGAPEEHLEVLLAGELIAAVGKPVDVPCLPTIDGWSAQQWRLFTTCFSSYRPQVLVFGVPREEGALAGDGKPRSTPAQLREQIAAAQAWCETNGKQLVLVADHGLPEPFAGEVRAAGAKGVPLVQLDARTPGELARALAAAIAPLLR
ncbi:MAG: hypothetical protein IPK26_07850 [Planctomycetes bacterium]|nr:hypothetical protein [Planctomycetota bacterium]